jgi:hypothetical protein
MENRTNEIAGMQEAPTTNQPITPIPCQPWTHAAPSIRRWPGEDSTASELRLEATGKRSWMQTRDRPGHWRQAETQESAIAVRITSWRSFRCPDVQCCRRGW